MAVATVNSLFIYFYIAIGIAIFVSLVWVVWVGLKVDKTDKDALLRSLTNYSSVMFVGILLPVAVCTVFMIWTDRSGSGNIWTSNNVVELFRTKSEYWVIGLWGEVIIAQILGAIFIVYDSIINSVSLIIAIPFIFLSLFSVSFGVMPYVVLRMIVFGYRHFQSQKYQGQQVYYS